MRDSKAGVGTYHSGEKQQVSREKNDNKRTGRRTFRFRSHLYTNASGDRVVHVIQKGGAAELEEKC